MNGFDLTKELSGLNRTVRQSLAAVGGATSPEMTACGKILRRTMARVLAVPGGAAIASSIKSRRLRVIGGTPSAPGEPPHAQTRQLMKSVKAGVVGTGIRVGPLRFTSLMLEQGVSATAGDRKQRNRPTTRSRFRGRRQLAGKVQRTLTVPARPYLERAVELAKDEMATAFGDLAGLSIIPSTR